jgi:N-acetylglucosaminyldiphosphoundecaprenol N-acetyl-beta-D-mannosaminyltransferase
MAAVTASALPSLAGDIADGDPVEGIGSTTQAASDELPTSVERPRPEVRSPQVPETLPPRPASFLGVPLHPITMDDTLEHVTTAMRERQRLQHVALNVAKFVKLRRDPELRADVFAADLVGVDGMGILIGARLLGIRVPERVAGVDLMERILALCAEEGFRPYFLGARPEVLALAEENIKQRHPKLRLAGGRHGYFCRAEELQVVEDIRIAKPDCLFVGMPTPRKERFMAAHCASLEVPFVMGVGGGIDVLAGHVQRAPEVWQNSGFEWLYRILQEPRRMWWRYLSTNVVYAGILTRALLCKAIQFRQFRKESAA